jgi:hypothetical protein
MCFDRESFLGFCLQTSLGGGEGIEGMYGSIKGSGMQKILDSMRVHCNLGSKSHIIDVGAGLGRWVNVLHETLV